MLGRFITAPGQDVTPLAMAQITSIPQAMGCSARNSRCTGISSTDRIAQGITQKPVIGTAVTLAATE